MTGKTQIHLPIAAAARDIILPKNLAEIKQSRCNGCGELASGSTNWHAMVFNLTHGRPYITFPKKDHNSDRELDRQWRATIDDPEYYTESWAVLMNIPWVDGQQISVYVARKRTAISNTSGK